MRAKIATVLIVWNVLACLATGAWLGYATMARWGTPARVKTLMDADVIDEAKLRERSPALAEDLPSSLGDWIVERERVALLAVSWTLIAVTGGNAILMISLAVSRGRPVEEAVGQTRAGWIVAAIVLSAVILLLVAVMWWFFAPRVVGAPDSPMYSPPATQEAPTSAPTAGQDGDPALSHGPEGEANE